MMRAWQRIPPRLHWSLFSQGCTSTTSLGLSLLAARLGGPAELGTVTVGFATYLLAVSFLRALLAEPLVVSTAGVEPRGRDAATAAALSMAVVGGLAVTALMVLLGSLVPGTPGRALLLFAPWMMPALLHESCRTVLFRDGRVAAAAASDAARVMGMAACLPLAWTARAGWSVVACWGIGAVCGAAAACALGGVRPAPLRRAGRWWAARAWPLGRWLAAESSVYSVGSQAAIFLLTGLIGPTGVGGLRAAQTVFAPLSLVVPVARLVALPAVARSHRISPAHARDLAVRWSVGLAVVAAVYAVVLGTVSRPVLSLTFGAAFAEYGGLVVPIGAWQVLAALGFGFSLLLKAAGRGRALCGAEAIGQSSTLAFMAFAAPRWGAAGAAWAWMASTGLTSLVLIAASSTGAGRAERLRAGAAIRTVPAAGRAGKSPVCS